MAFILVAGHHCAHGAISTICYHSISDILDEYFSFECFYGDSFGGARH